MTADDTTVRLVPGDRVAVAGRSHPGRVRTRNEDAFLIAAVPGDPPDPDACRLIGVADGVGGHSAGDVASELALDAVEATLDGFPSLAAAPEEGWREALDAALLGAVADADRAVREHARGRPDLEGMATTLVVAVLCRGWLGVAHVGDSRAHVVRGDRLHRLTNDHTWGAEARERGEMDEGEIARSPLRESITRAVGLARGADADIAWLALAPGDVVLLATDGLTRYVDETGILDALREAGPRLERAADALIARALAAGGRDNVTVVLARFDGPAAEPLPGGRPPAEPPGP